MSLSTLPLSYCTNVHPGKNLAEVLHGLEDYTVPARRELGERIAAGLWLSASTIRELNDAEERIEQLSQALQGGDLVCYTLNTFPYGDFHSERVKENVYLPNWTAPERLTYTHDCARVLSRLLPPGTEGSLSTVPLGFKGFEHPPDFLERCIAQLLHLSEELDALHDETGQVIRLAIEPEPLCVLETTNEATAFFQQLFDVADRRGLGDAARRHLGLCYDICHQSVEFEDVAASIREIHAAGIRINKVHITCAIQVVHPAKHPEALEELARYAEPRYLHQTFAQTRSGIVHRLDLTPELCTSPPAEFLAADAWRVHFHVPVHRESLGPLGTTRGDLQRGLAAVAELEYAPHLEVETYTWGVLPESTRQLKLTEGLVAELSTTQRLLEEIRTARPVPTARVDVEN